MKTQIDCLERALVPVVPVETELCITTIVSSGFGHWLDDWLGSLFERGDCENALVAIFVVDGAEDCVRVISQYNKERPILMIPVQSLVPVTTAIKGVICSVARFVKAQRYICLEADMLVLNSLQPLSEMIGFCPESILTVQPNDVPRREAIEERVVAAQGSLKELKALVGDLYAPELRFGNGGLICGSRTAMLALDEQIQKMMPYAAQWVDARPDVGWRDECILNLAMHQLSCNVQIDDAWNLQLHIQAFEQSLTAVGKDRDFRLFKADATPINLVHFVGHSKKAFASWRGHFSRCQ